LVSKEQLIELIGNTNIAQEMDVRLVVLDAIRRQMNDDEIDQLFWENLHRFSEEEIQGYFYRKR
jgi:hypothetical protein